MSNYPEQQGFGPAYTQPPRQGSGCFGKLLGCCGITALVLIAICCGGLFYGRTWINDNITSDPVKVQQIADEIATIKVPDGFLPKVAGRIKVPFSGRYLGKGVLFVNDDGRAGILLMFELGNIGDENTKQRMREQIETSLTEKSGGGGPEPLTNIVTTKKERKINGDEAVFEIVEGVGQRTGKKRIHVNGTFQGKGGPVVITLDSSEEKLTKEKVEEMIDSIE